MEFIQSIKCSTGEYATTIAEAQIIELAAILRNELDPKNPAAGKTTAAVIVKHREEIVAILSQTGKPKRGRKPKQAPEGGQP